MICCEGILHACQVFCCLLKDFWNMIVHFYYYLPLAWRIYLHYQSFMYFVLCDSDRIILSYIFFNMLIISWTTLDSTCNILVCKHSTVLYIVIHLCYFLWNIHIMGLFQIPTHLMSWWDPYNISTPPERYHKMPFSVSGIWLVSLFCMI